MEKDKSQMINYSEAIKIIKTAILQSQYMATKAINTSQLSPYYGVGQYVSQNSREGFWGMGAIENISGQLYKELPGLRGFSAANIKFMRQFYETWRSDVKSLTAISDLDEHKTLTTVSEIDASQLMDTNVTHNVFLLSDFLSLGFTHHMIIVRKTKSSEERIFYIHQAVLNRWNKSLLHEYIKEDLFHHQGVLPNNFTNTISDTNSALRAMEMFKDEYLLTLRTKRNIKRIVTLHRFASCHCRSPLRHSFDNAERLLGKLRKSRF